MKKYAAEFLGTFILVFIGTGAATVNEISNNIISHAGVAITFGLVIMSMIFVFGEKSGAHLNPAVTIAFYIHRVFPTKEVLPYILSQLAGAFTASLFLNFLFPASNYLGGTYPAGSILQSLMLEILLTFILMLTILHVSENGKEKGLLPALTIGAVVLIEAMFGGPVSGASMNPARSLAPAFVSGQLHYFWIYIVAPISGAVGAVFTYRLIK